MNATDTNSAGVQHLRLSNPACWQRIQAAGFGKVHLQNRGGFVAAIDSRVAPRTLDDVQLSLVFCRAITFTITLGNEKLHHHHLVIVIVAVVIVAVVIHVVIHVFSVHTKTAQCRAAGCQKEVIRGSCDIKFYALSHGMEASNTKTAQCRAAEGRQQLLQGSFDSKFYALSQGNIQHTNGTMRSFAAAASVMLVTQRWW